MSNIYKDNFQAYLDAGLSVIPDKYMGKQPAIKEWSKYCYQLPTQEEAESWSHNIPKSNIALALGEASGIVALDVDATDPKVLEVIMPILPPSPAIKKGEKGETRFYRYIPEHITATAKINGQVAVELLSAGRKSTLPPSIHPNGTQYKWTSDTTLLECHRDLPLLGPLVLSNIQAALNAAFPDLVWKGGFKATSGRNQELSSLCGKMIQERVPMEDAILALLEKDKEMHEVPLFSDPDEMRCTEPYTNALQFYANHLSSINSKRFYKGEEYETPILPAAINQEAAALVAEGKPQRQVSRKKESLPLPTAHGAIASLTQNILQNSYVEQPQLALAASLAFVGTLISRKVTHLGIAPNQYYLSLAPSGSGKDLPQKQVQRYLTQIGQSNLLGAGDYVSSAALMDSFESKPVRLDIIDEASKLFISGDQGYDAKIADILCELYTASNDRFNGRTLASMNGTFNVRGACIRPNVNLLCSTTPAGFSNSVTGLTLDKGLLGRFMVFSGEMKRGRIVEKKTPLEPETVGICQFLADFVPGESGDYIGQINQEVLEIGITPEGAKLRKKYQEEFEDIKIELHSTEEQTTAIAARLLTHMIKCALIHSCGREAGIRDIDEKDIQFGYEVTKLHLHNITWAVKECLYATKSQRHNKQFLALFNDGELSREEIWHKTSQLNHREREDIIKGLEAAGIIEAFLGENRVKYYRRKGC